MLTLPTVIDPSARTYLETGCLVLDALVEAHDAVTLAGWRPPSIRAGGGRFDRT